VVATYHKLLAVPKKRSLRTSFGAGAAVGAGQSIMFLSYALAFWYGGRLVDTGEMTLEKMLKVFFSVLFALSGVSQSQLVFPDLAKGSSAVKRLFRGMLPHSH
jgi:ATP-binding cassette, subfamily B (MDR/TAP), member 1